MTVTLPAFRPQWYPILCIEGLHTRHYSLPAIPRHVGAWGPLSLGLSVCDSLAALPTEAWPLFWFGFVSKLFFAHTKVTVACLFLYFLDVVEVTVGSLVDGTEITQLV